MVNILGVVLVEKPLRSFCDCSEAKESVSTILLSWSHIGQNTSLPPPVLGRKGGQEVRAGDRVTGFTFL